MRRLEMQVSLGAVCSNARAIRGRLDQNVKMLAVIKADAYGHGAKEVAGRLIRDGLADAFAVATADEGAIVRSAGISNVPIVVLGYSGYEDSQTIVEYGLSQAVFDEEGLFNLSEASKKCGKRAKAHLKIDTGMSRIGVKGISPLTELLDAWKKYPSVEMEGLFTHFSCADVDEEFTALQARKFLKAKELVHSAGFSPICHASASSAMFKGEYMYDMVRAGISLYGVPFGSLKGQLSFAQKLCARPVRIEWIDAGEKVGYGGKFVSQRRTRVMTVPCGYGDGYPRILSGRADVIVNGKRAPVIGNICMDMLMADVTDAGDITKDSIVTLLGRDGTEEITPEELALKAETIPYEIMLGFAPRVERRFTDQ